jgi:sialate O-acetylesterase
MAVCGHAAIKLPAVISDGMVVQQASTAPIWGWADAGANVYVRASWLWTHRQAKADDQGRWRIDLPTPTAGGPHHVAVSTDAGDALTLNNVLVGEVWVCSGQSNMEMAVASSDNANEEIAAADYPAIRMFTVQKAIAVEPQTDCKGSWQTCSPQTVGGFSAAGYFFARHLHKELKVPVGMIHTSWGGTPAEAWTSARALKTMPDYAAAVEAIEKAGPDVQRQQAEYDRQMAEWSKNMELAVAVPAAAEWMKPDIDDGDWKTVAVPREWGSTELGGFDGEAWFRTTFEVPAAWSGKDLTLSLGPIDDMDITWVNGREVGRTMTAGNWQTPRVYKVPADCLRRGANVLAVRVLDTQGGGGLTGEPAQVHVRPDGDDAAQPLVLAGKWRYKLGFDMETLPPRPTPPAGNNPNAPTALYNAMLAPLIPYGIKGAIWYQGESNAGRAYQYRELFPLMITNWRQDWGREAFPFHFVQIAPFEYGGPPFAAELREAQMMTLALPNTGMAVTMDIGNPKDIHPRNKQDVGKRLALWAMAKDYGRDDIVYSGPLYKSMKIEGDKIRLSFDCAEGGLVARGGPLTHFIIAGDDQNFVEAAANIDGDTIVASSDQVDRPVAVRYGWTNAAEPNLFNAAGLPASSFRTDTWPGVTSNNK